jgi:hypothetical protein
MIFGKPEVDEEARYKEEFLNGGEEESENTRVNTLESERDDLREEL